MVLSNQEPTTGKQQRDTHSRVVGVLKWIFPVLAVVLLGSIFLLSKTKIGGIIDIDPKVLELAQGQKITNPHFSGVTKSGDAFSISAEWALPDGPRPEQIELSNPRTTINFKNGRTMRTESGAGDLNLRSSEALLSGGVQVVTTNGYTATSTNVNISFETGNVLSEGPVRANGPVGSIESGTMILTQNLDRNPAGHAVLMFNNGVKLIYKPK